MGAVLGAAALTASLTTSFTASPSGPPAGGGPGQAGANRVNAAMVERTMALFEGLDAARRELARTGFGDAERRTWQFGPVRREGLPIGSLDAASMGRLEGLLDTALSDSGIAAWHQIRALESELRRRESTPDKVAAHRDPDLYWLRVYGEPSVDSAWSWRFEGHHLALHVACAPNTIPTVTPFFLGASPLFVDDPTTPTDELVPSVDAFVRLNGALQGLVRSLDDPQAAASLPEIARPGDVRMGPGVHELPAPLGLDLRTTGDDPRERLADLLDVYQSFLDEPLRSFGLAEGLASEGDVGVRFVRWGSTDLGEPRAWALRTPTFVLEFATTTGSDHVHVLLRDSGKDFGGR